MKLKGASIADIELKAASIGYLSRRVEIRPYRLYRAVGSHYIKEEPKEVFDDESMEVFIDGSDKSNKVFIDESL